MSDSNERLDKLEHLIRGNGKPGLNDRVRNVERVIETQKRVFWILLIAFTAQSTAVIGTLIATRL